MATIMCLPQEVIDKILGYNDISIEDIINFRFVCKQFRWAAKNKKYCFFKKKFFQRWPNAKRHYDRQFKDKVQSEKNKQNNKRDITFIKTGINCARQSRNYVFQMIKRIYFNNKSIDNLISEFHYNIFFSDLFHLKNKFKDDLKISFLVDEIENLLAQSPRRGCDLTERYCNTQLCIFLHLKRVYTRLHRFYFKQSDREQLLELLATIFARKFQLQESSYSCVKMSLDNIAQEILNCLRQKYPDHSIFSMFAENFSYWKNNNIYESYWNKAEGTKILDTLEEYLFGKLNFRACSLEQLRCTVADDPTNLKEFKRYMCIDYVLENKYGHELIVLIIYNSVARRLGLHCDIIEPKSLCFGMCVYWKPNYSTDNSRNVRCFTIKSGTNDLIQQSSDNFHVLNTEMIEQKFTRLFCYYNEFYNAALICMNGSNTFKQLKLYVDKTSQSRPQDVEFAVGMIVTFGIESAHRFVGVIIGWHRYVDRNNVKLSEIPCEDTRLILPLKICSEPLCRFKFETFKQNTLSDCIKQQTHYIILSENNEMCYVEEDAISLATPKCIDNTVIGRYFCRFEGTHYLPNEMLAGLYPHDAAVTARIMSKN
ncbi:uncharacterized protein [Anoplolepis gracilipes]|uniref:uncharacterized protein n=1 Tax=Anoplolepis gracilipes TaxID=354296 RepID=UPI003BA0E2CC